MKYYTYNADIGTFSIRKVEDHRYQLWINEEMLGEYDSPELAAADVANFNTDYVEWDELEDRANAPHSIREWSIVTEEKPPK